MSKTNRILLTLVAILAVYMFIYRQGKQLSQRTNPTTTIADTIAVYKVPGYVSLEGPVDTSLMHTAKHPDSLLVIKFKVLLCDGTVDSCSAGVKIDTRQPFNVYVDSTYHAAPAATVKGVEGSQFTTKSGMLRCLLIRTPTEVIDVMDNVLMFKVTHHEIRGY